jgi:5'-nucleotidase
VYLGYIDVEFDPSGKILGYTGGPVLLDNKTAQDTELQKDIAAWRGPFEEFSAVVLGTSNIELAQAGCQSKECALGDFMCDAMLDARSNQVRLPLLYFI